MESQSIIDIPESGLVKLLYDDPMFRRKLLPFDCGEHWRWLEVPLSRVTSCHPPLKGDVDLLVIPTVTIPDGIAIQLKRIKVGSATFSTGLANKVHEIRKLAQQTNRLVEIGFHWVRASILLVVDSRESGSPDPWLEQAPLAVESDVNLKIASSGFHSAVCVEVLQICQPFDADFRLRGSTSRRLIQPGRSQPQREEISRSILVRLASAM